MSSDPPAKPKGLSLYANLLESKEAAPGTISSAPVLYKQPSNGDAADEAPASKQNINAASLRFQPTRRPQVGQQKPKSTPAKVGQPPPAPSSGSPDATSGAPPPAPLSQQPKTTIADWTAEGDEDEYYFGANQRQRGGRKKRRKKDKEQGPVAQDWDDIYDPSRPNSYEEYKHSDEKMRELREWKDQLYAHRMARRGSGDSDSEEEDRRPAMQFAPPPGSYAPPPPPPPPPEPEPYVPPPPPATVPNASTGEDAYARRLRLSQQAAGGAPPPAAPPPPPPSIPAPAPAATIARAAVRYNLPMAPAELPATDAELEAALQHEADAPDDAGADEDNAPRSLRPGQRGFAERLMAKYGWTKGSGLGANATGIVTPLQAKIAKQKKRPDAEGGGFVGPGGRGTIVGGKKKGGAEQESRFGPMSEVVVLRGMVDGMDLAQEMGEGNLMQEIGEECGDKYGRVERVFIDPTAAGSVPVFIKFTSQLSALRAVNALEGRAFNGNTIVARFFDSDRFDHGVYS